MTLDYDSDELTLDLFLDIESSKSILEEQLIVFWEKRIDEAFYEHFDFEVYGEEDVDRYLHDFISDELYEMGVDCFTDNEIIRIAEHCDTENLIKEKKLEERYSESRCSSWIASGSSNLIQMDPIDDLFSRD